MKYLFLTFLSILLFGSSFSEVRAQIVINEFSSGSSSDWIELYNISTESADLTPYKLMDSGTSNDKILSGTVSSGGFISFSFSNWLNNGGDTVRLFKNEILVDAIAYGGSDQVCNAGENESIGRYPDGNHTVERFSVQTRDSPNNATVLNPCPTATPVPTSTPTATPRPTNTPRPTQIPTPVPTATSVATPPQTTQGPVTPTRKPVPKFTNTPILEASSQELVLGIKEIKSPRAEVSSGEETEEGKKFPFFPVILIVTGLFCLGGALVYFIRNNVKKIS